MIYVYINIHMLNIIINASNTSRFSRTPCNLVHSLESIERSPLPRPKFSLLSSSLSLSLSLFFSLLYTLHRHLTFACAFMDTHTFDTYARTHNVTHTRTHPHTCSTCCLIVQNLVLHLRTESFVKSLFFPYFFFSR